MHHFSGVKIIALGVSAAALSACSMPRHQDAVFFGTDTKIALDVGVQPENGNTPSVTFGYKRREFVYMPLAEYGPAPQTGLVESIVAGDAFRKTSVDKPAEKADATTSDNPPGKHHKYKGEGRSGEVDSYSVFATFGGNFSGSSGQGANASARIKQVFATGIAAQIAAENGADYVNPSAPDANAKAAAAEATAATLAIVNESERTFGGHLDTVLACASPEKENQREKWKTLIDNTKAKDPNARDVIYLALSNSTTEKSVREAFALLGNRQRALVATEAKDSCPQS